jgi:tetratricopeptide (TPR) repeat protein
MNAASHTPVSSSSRPRSPEFIRTAKALLLRRRTNEAINLLRRGLNLDPSCTRAALLLSKALVAAKRLREARGALEKLIAREESEEALVLLARVCDALDDHAGALEVCRRGLALFPKAARLKELEARARVELTELLDDTVDGARRGQIDPEDLPTTRMPEGGHAGLPFLSLLAEADEPMVSRGREASRADTVQMPGTALALPPVVEELSTSPNYREADDGVLEDLRVTGERTPTPLPADDLGFDRTPEAPNLVSAVRQLVEPCAPEEPPRRPLFVGLLRDSTPTPKRARPPRLPARPKVKEDTAEVGGLTPAASPAARQRLEAPPPISIEPRTAGREDPPTMDLRARRASPARLIRLQDPLGQVQAHHFDDSRVVLPVGGELISLDSPSPPVTMPSPRAPRVVVDNELQRPPRRPVEPPAQPQEETAMLTRLWPLWLTLALMIIAAATVAGLVVRQQGRVTRSLHRARLLADQHQERSLKQALHRVREAANLGGRRPEVVALAAAIHAELACEYGESDLRTASSLVEESVRLDGEQHARARSDLAVARAYLRVCSESLPDAISHLLESLDRHPRIWRLKLLYGRALIQNGELDLARKVLGELPTDDGWVLQARALLHFKAGHHDLARRLLTTATAYGLPRAFVELELARLETVEGEATPETLQRLKKLVRDPTLPSNQMAWAQLLVATLHHAGRRDLQAAWALGRALASRPRADAVFSYQAGRLLLALHRHDEALREAKEACRISPRNPRYVALQAAVELAIDRPAKAIQRLNTALELTGEGRRVLAEAYIRSGNLAGAKELLEMLPDGSPDKKLTWARYHLADGKPYRALKVLAGLDGPSVEAQVLRGLAALETGDTAGAMRWMRSVLKKDPMLHEALHALGRVARREGNAQHAREMLTKAVKANPHHRRARLDLGELLLQLKEVAAAQRQFDKVLALDNGNLDARIGRAWSAVELGSTDAPTYIRDLAIRGQAEEAAVLEARHLLVQKKWERAADALAALLDREERGGPAREHRTSILLWLAEAEQRSGNLSTAARLYRRVVERRPKGAPRAQLGLSEIDLARNTLGSALRHGIAAAKDLTGGIHPVSLRARIGVQLARCYRLGDALGASIAELQDVLELDPSHLPANLELGMIYASLSKRDRAVHHLARVLELDSRNKLARKELARVCDEIGSPLPPECLRK